MRTRPPFESRLTRVRLFSLILGGCWSSLLSHLRKKAFFFFCRGSPPRHRSSFVGDFLSPWVEIKVNPDTSASFCARPGRVFLLAHRERKCLVLAIERFFPPTTNTFSFSFIVGGFFGIQALSLPRPRPQFILFGCC